MVSVRRVLATDLAALTKLDAHTTDRPHVLGEQARDPSWARCRWALGHYAFSGFDAFGLLRRRRVRFSLAFGFGLVVGVGFGFGFGSSSPTLAGIGWCTGEGGSSARGSGSGSGAGAGGGDA